MLNSPKKLNSQAFCVKTLVLNPGFPTHCVTLGIISLLYLSFILINGTHDAYILLGVWW